MQTQPFLIRDEFGHTTIAPGHGVNYSTPMRWSRAGIYLGCGLTLGLASVFVPVVQFYGPILFPSVGLLLAAWTLQIRAHADRVTGACPHCGDPVVLGGYGPSYPLADSCPKCRHLLTVEPTDEIEMPVEADPREEGDAHHTWV